MMVTRATLAGLTVILALAGCAREQGEVVYARAGGLNLEISMHPDPPKQNGTVLDITILDGSGARVAGVDVDVEYSMPGMGAMPAMHGEAEVVPRAAGLYRAELDLPMGGSWTLAIEVERDGEVAAAEFTMTVGRKGLVPAAGSLAEAAEPAGAHVHPGSGEEIAYYTCPMHPSVKSPDPGTCPICSMDLTPVRRRELETGVITVPPERLQSIGVRTTEVERRDLETTIRTVGRITYDETRLSDVSTKYGGWIGKLYVNATGQRVEKGDPLFTVYSPELFAAQQELLAGMRSRRAANATSAPDRADYLVEAARSRLRLWDLTEAQIDSIIRGGEPLEQVPILSPISGYVVEKNVVEGASIEPGDQLYRIAGLETVWVEAEVYEADLPLVAVGMSAEVTLPFLPGRTFEGRVAFVYPYLNQATRTARVRIEVENPELALKPDMYGHVVFHVDLGERLVVPEEAVLYVGDRRFVFVSLGGGRLEPRKVTVGRTTDDWTEILDGLEAGEVVVTSGNFLIAAESRLKTAMEQWR